MSGGLLSSYVLRRWLACLFLIFATYNPSQYSFFHWLMDTRAWSWGLASTGVILAGAYLLVFQVILSSIGWPGLMAGAVVAILTCIEVIRFRAAAGQLQWLIEIMLLTVVASTLATGISWSQIATHLTGQVHKRYLNKAKKPTPGP